MQPESSDSVYKNRDCLTLVVRQPRNIGGGMLWLCDLEKLQRHFEIKGVIAEGDNIALLIRNYQP